uniref:putative Polycomb group protein ASXL2 isoform X2 n=1 Tax=Doryrhamphus excisus TaxID=161450 RepID=UPI0025AE0C9C|nr:putative Polycomb group protein ASXL2 isoform X2 [Doryrhamphus excisus]
MRERQKKKKGRTWAEAAKTVLEKYPNTPMSHKEILQVIQRERLKEISGTSPLACLNAMLHTNSRGEEGMFYKVPGRMGVYTLKDISEVAKEMSEEASDDSSDNLSDSRSIENGNNGAHQEGRRRKWMRRVPSKLQSQPPPPPSSSSPPQPRSSSPSVPAAKLISPSQKHSKKALKQALKQQQQRNQRRQGVMPTTSSSRLLLKTIKDMADNITAKTDLCLPVVPRKVSQRSSRLSAGHLKRNRCKIDVETPDSILVNTNLRAIINKHTFSVLPPDCQQKLLRLLPEVDQQACVDGLLKVTSSALNNEFFTSAAQAWKERLAEGEFTPELQLRMRQEIEKEKKVEHWKEVFFESYYGENSGLSFEESKELTKVDLKWETKPHAPVGAVKASEGIKAVKNRNRADGAGAKSTPTQSPKPSKPSSLPTPEPMKTRRSQDRKMHAALQSAPTSAPPPNERAPEVTCIEKIEKDNQPEAELPQSPARTSPPPQASAVNPPKEMRPQPDGTPEDQKRKSPGAREDEVTPEKRPRLSSVSSPASSVSSVSPPESSIPSPATPTPTGNPRVPPLKIPVSRILPAPVSPSPVPPRTPLPSPARTGARTLADIKAKAQLARAQRAAAGASKRTMPILAPTSPTSPPTSARLAAPTYPQDPLGPLSPSPWKQDSTCTSTASVQPQKPAQSLHAAKCQDTLYGSTGTNSCIPANNPLVTRLLQGKEVPLEQILPKPLTKTEVKMNTSYSGVDGGGPEPQQHGTQRFSLPDNNPRPHREPPDKDTQEQILQTLMERKVQAADGEGHLDRPWTSVGFLARKRTPRPAMSGHYLLNVSTYGRGSESKRCHQAAIPNVCAVKRESADGDAKGEVPGTESEDAGAGVKTEPGSEYNSGGTDSNQKQPEPRNRGRSEPYPLLTDGAHQRQRKSVHQEPAAARYGGTISMSIPHALKPSPPSSSDASSVMSFSVTVTTIPAGNSLDHGGQSQTSPDAAFMESAAMDDGVQSQCYCRLKAMIMCKGCGAFCHHDCIGPSELCVSCLVVR